ncbi:AAA family ATPase [Mangrovimonas futianensis]|uniref:AAA family ATPase n=1 Tax=Mangrovimonas futianensis TaxID=2895523 RepID=UPI001E4E3234|nr:ATP-binding protein [Mangrovimonas futianensis]MCF1420584.1 ATP-binding protein [Mangrovimonas futianensis]
MEEKLKQQSRNIIKVVLFGPESTGKSTLAEQLANHYQTKWVQEYSRIYAEEKWQLGETLSEKDVLPIAFGQMKEENKLSKQVERLLICDTDLLETKVYSEWYYSGFCPDPVQKFALENTYDLYFLTYIDLPWVADNIRDKPNEREEMFQTFQQALINHKRPFVLLKGDQATRFNEAVKQIDKLLSKTYGI